MLFLATESWDKMLHKTNFVTLYLCTLEEVDHSQTKGWKSGIKSVQRQTHCDIGFLRVFLQTVGTTSWNLDWLPEKQGRVPACQPCFSLALGGAGQRHCRHPAQSPVLGPPATPALTAKKKRKGPVTVCTCCHLQCTLMF